MKFVTRAILFVLLIGPFSVSAQLFEISFDPIFKKQNGDVLSMALAGGLNQPQFSNLDLNNDGNQDLVVYDRTGDKVLTFLSTFVKGTLEYRYDPTYEQYFPKGEEFYLLKDFDGDEKPDIWLYTGDSTVIYRNTTTSLPTFTKHKSLYAYDRVNFTPFNPNKKINQTIGCLPAIEDLEGDGDVDFVTNLNSSGSALILNCNNTVDSGKSLLDISFEIPDKCYGGIDEWNGQMVTNAFCFFRESYEGKKKKHAATKTLMFFDNDDDGDMDLFYGSSEKTETPIYYFENGKADLGNYYKDTFISIDTNYFTRAVFDKMAIAPGAFYVDIDLDGTKDLILASNERDKSSYPILETKNVMYLKNNGTDTKPDFDFVTDEFLVGHMVDYGEHTAPAFADLDGDGDQDLVIATNGNHRYTYDTSDYLIFYKNVGSVVNPIFQEETVDFANVKQEAYQNLVPEFADLDDDGDFDLYLGTIDGNIVEYLNTGTKTTPNFVLNTTNFDGINPETSSAPLFHDLNNDGLEDLLLGSYDGTIRYYTNSGTLTVPSFTLENDSFGGIVVNELIRQSILTQNGFVDTFIYNYYGYSKPSIAYFKDSSMAICVGGDEGKVRVYCVDSDLSKDFKEQENYMLTYFENAPYAKDWGERVYPSSADLNNDGISDMLIGNSRGGLNYLEGLDSKVCSKASFKRISKKTESFILAPNPAAHTISITAPTSAQFTYTISSVNGRVIQTGLSYSGNEIKLDGSISNGLYFVGITNDEGNFLTQKLVVFK